MSYSLMIEIPAWVEIEKPPKPIRAAFETKEEWEKYKDEESAYTYNAFKKTKTAWSPHQKAHAWSELYASRLSFYQKWFKRPADPGDQIA